MTEPTAAEQLRTWERRLLIVAFTGWAAVVAAYGQAAVNRIDIIVKDNVEERKSQAAQNTLIERRLTSLEAQQVLLIRMYDKLEQRTTYAPIERNQKPDVER